MENKIKRVTSINQLGSRVYTVGCEGVIEIRDNSLEFENTIHIQYDAYGEGDKLIGTFINGALAIDYF